MKVFEQWRYRNPLDILLASEARSCKGCVHVDVAFDRQFCSKGKKYGRRCAAYQEKQFHREEVMQQARKAAVGETLHEQSPYSMVLALWAQWMRLADHQYSMGDGNEQDTKDFMRTGEAVDSMINDLPRHLWWAVRKSRGICTVWHFPGIKIEDALQKAEEILTAKMKNHVATRRYFN